MTSRDKVKRWLEQVDDTPAMLSSTRKSSRLQAMQDQVERAMHNNPSVHDLNPSDSTVSSELNDRPSSRVAPSSLSAPRSLTKQMTGLNSSEVKIVFRGFEENGYKVPKEVTSLFRNLRSIGIQKQIIPLKAKEHLLKHLSGEQDCAHYLVKDKGDNLTPWKSVRKLCQSALAAQRRNSSEAGWNQAVHGPILECALNSRCSTRIGYRNITAARIADATLLPTRAGTKTTMQGKMVDYAIVIEPLTKVEKIIIKKVNEGLEINSTSAECVRFNPIGIGTKTERDAQEDTAAIQLGTWVFAHFARLKQLTSAKLPVLPVLLVQGHTWSFMLAQRQKDQVLILRSLIIGDTNTVLGTYQVLAAIKRLAR